MTGVQEYYSTYERSIAPKQPRSGPLNSNTRVYSTRTKPNAIVITTREPMPKLRPQDQVRPDLPILAPADKPAGYYLALRHSRSLDNQLESQNIRPLLERKDGVQLTFDCLPNKKLRAGTQYRQLPPAILTQNDIEPPAPKQPLRSNFYYYSIYERSPNLTGSLEQQSSPPLKSTTEVPLSAASKWNTLGQYPDYELP